ELGGRSAAADLGDQHDLAVGVKPRLIGILEDLAVDRDGHALVDLMAKAGKTPVELSDHPAHRIGLDLDFGLAAGKAAGRLAGDDDLWHWPPHIKTRSPLSPNAGRGRACGAYTAVTLDAIASPRQLRSLSLFTRRGTG